MKILECAKCGLVTLNQIDHLVTGFYEDFGMHGEEPLPIDAWLNDSMWDDKRRSQMLNAMLPNKRLEDFCCGAAEFLRMTQSIAAEVTGIQFEARVLEHWAGRLNTVSSTEGAGEECGLITASYVVAHLSDPRLVW